MATINGVQLTWGMTTETATLVQSARITRKVDDKRYRDATGEVATIVEYNLHSEWNIEFLPAGTSGLNAIAPAVALTIANIAESGLEIPLEVNIEFNNEDAKKITASGVSHPAITS